VRILVQSSVNLSNMASSAVHDLIVLADSNVQDPKPSTLTECLGREFILHRVTTMASLTTLEIPPETLRYMVVACLAPLIAESSNIPDVDEKEMSLGDTYHLKFY
jgi:hypothetical protein